VPSAKPPVKVVFVGDSITEAFVGTSLGLPSSRADGVPEVFERVTAPYKPVHVNGMSGDQTQHLLYRLQASPLPPGLVYVVLIGTNNLGAGFSIRETAAGINAVVSLIAESSPASKVLLSSILPRGDSRGATQSQVAAVNELLSSRPYLPNVLVVSCGGVFAENPASPEAEWTVDEALMPDLLHPNAEGTEKWFAGCLGEAVETALGGTGSGAAEEEKGGTGTGGLSV